MARKEDIGWIRFRAHQTVQFLYDAFPSSHFERYLISEVDVNLPHTLEQIMGKLCEVELEIATRYLKQPRKIGGAEQRGTAGLKRTARATDEHFGY